MMVHSFAPQTRVPLVTPATRERVARRVTLGALATYVAFATLFAMVAAV